MVWHAIYTKARWEKKVLQQLQEKQITAYLPLYKTLKQWSDRKKLVEEPLFKSYIFVKVDPSQYYDALNVNGAVRYVTFQGKASVVPEQQIKAIQIFLEQYEENDPLEVKIPKGSEVEIVAGPLKGINGIMENEGNSNRVYILIESVGQEISVEIPRNNLRPVSSSPRNTI